MLWSQAVLGKMNVVQMTVFIHRTHHSLNNKKKKYKKKSFYFKAERADGDEDVTS